MIGLLQRVSRASVAVAGENIASIDAGLLVFVGVEKGDEKEQAEKLFNRLVNYRVFSDAEGKMNLSLKDDRGELLLVPQFTLAADTSRGRRPGFQSAASPEKGKDLFEYLCEFASTNFGSIQAGQFGADMQVSLLNNGPVTFWLKA